MTFNRDKDFDESTYVKVNERLTQFRKEHPQGKITTFRTDTERGVSFKTIICRDSNETQDFGLTGIAAATGHSFLPDDLRGDKVEEYSETVSVGRALAMLGYGVEKSVASAEEMNRFKKMKSTPRATTNPTPPNPQDSGAQEGEEAVTPTAPLPKLKTASKFNLNKIAKKEA
jgi:hypothetical protein